MRGVRRHLFSSPFWDSFVGGGFILGSFNSCVRLSQVSENVTSFTFALLFMVLISLTWELESFNFLESFMMIPQKRIH